MVDYTQLRINMVENQLKPCEIDNSQLIKAALLVKREEFLPEEFKHNAYIDDHILFDHVHYMMRPQLLFLMVQSLNIQLKDRVLDVGCTFGYSSSLLSYLAERVVGLEEQEKFIQHASKVIHAQKATNTKFVKGNYLTGYTEEAPYNAILVQRAYPFPPEILLEQLAPAGRLVYVQQSDVFFGKIILLTRGNSHFSQTTIDEVCMPYYHYHQQGFQL